MLNYNNHYITAMTYNNHTIKKAYGCDGRLVWKRQGGEGYENQYLTVIPRANGTMYWFGMSYGTRCYYSMDSGLTWSKLDGAINVSEGQKIMLKKEWYEDEYKIALPSGQLKLTTNYDIEGNIMSMVYSDDFYGKTDLSGKDRAFTSFLKPNMVRIEGELYPIKYGPVNAENLVLPATTLSSGCYSNMFQGCEMLEKAPKELPAMELTPACYSEMFENCSNLTKAPFLPANILVGVDTSIDSGCYNHMFLGCRKLNEITCLATNQETSSLHANYLMHHWVAGVAETGTFYKYSGSRWRVSDENGNSIPMGWTVKDYNPQPPFTGKWKATYADSRVFSAECDSTSAITEGEITKENLVQIEIGQCVTSIGDSAFSNATGLTSIKVWQTTPPTLGGTPFANTGNAPILVPASSVDLYKSQWSGYASRIQPIQ